jgi:hypothetical protein
MTSRSSTSRLVAAAVLALALAAVPGTRAAGAPGPVRANRVSLAPLFDTKTRFKPKKTVNLKFRVKDKAASAPVALEGISFSLVHGRGTAAVPLTAREVRKGVFEVPFTPPGPGQYAVVASLRDAPALSIPPIRLGVVGVADGLIEEPPEADVEAQRKGRKLGKRR